MTAAAVLVVAGAGCSSPAPAPAPESRDGRDPVAVFSLFADVVRACAGPVDAAGGIGRGAVATAGWTLAGHQVTRGGVDADEPALPPATLGVYDMERIEWRRGRDTMTLLRRGRAAAGAEPAIGGVESDTCTAEASVRSDEGARTVLAGVARLLHSRPQASGAVYGGGDVLAPNHGKPVGREHGWYLPAHDVTLQVGDDGNLQIEVASPPKNPTARRMFERSGAEGARL